MKVNLYMTVEVSDEQRVLLARMIDGADAKKRIATRDEIKDYIWKNGRDWAAALNYDSDLPDDLDDDDLI